MARRRINIELRDLRKRPPAHVLSVAEPLEQKPLFRQLEREDTRGTALEATLAGPEGTLYADGEWKLNILLPEQYPHKPPHVRLATPMFHPNVSARGTIGGLPGWDALLAEWEASSNVRKLLEIVTGLFTQLPNLDDPARPELGELLLDDPDEYGRRAREHTAEHAMWRQKALEEDLARVERQMCQEKVVPHRTILVGTSSVSSPLRESEYHRAVKHV